MFAAETDKVIREYPDQQVTVQDYARAVAIANETGARCVDHCVVAEAIARITGCKVQGMAHLFSYIKEIESDTIERWRIAEVDGDSKRIEKLEKAWDNEQDDEGLAMLPLPINIRIVRY